MQEIKSQLKEIQQSQARVEIDIAMIKVDVSHHIKRSDAADLRINRIENLALGFTSALILAVIGWLLRR